ncbi:MAG: site-specific DNA-methyltransferase [Clostridium sp.]|nr:site-specific DNA-methyltransferase [Clostridium sp.]
MDKLKMHTPNKADENFKKLAALFPNAVTETIDENGEVVRAIDKDVLMQEISCTVVEGSEERYQFTWPDKKKSVLLANAPINKTLRPCREESVNFDTTENLYIEGDNLEVLKLLQETYLGKIKMIYIDPPYNTGNDFVYEDDFAQSAEEYMANSGQYDDEGNRLVKNVDTNGRFHTDWLNMIYPRLKVAKDLLSDDGAIFISINDQEVSNMKKICDEIFGCDNFIASLIWQQRKGGGNDSHYIAVDHEYILIYSKNICNLSNRWYVSQTEEYLKRYKEVEPDGRRFYWDTLVRNGLQSPIVITLTAPDGTKITINSQKSEETVLKGLRDGTVRFTKTTNGWSLHHKVYMKEGQVLRSILTEYGNNRSSGQELTNLFGKTVFDYSKPSTLLKLLCQLNTNNIDIVLDFFSGSATTAHAVMKLNAEDGGNRKFIMVQLPEETDEKSEAYKVGYKNICEIGGERIRRAAKKIAEENPNARFDGGFRVLKCDSSNMKDVYYSPADFELNLLDMMEDNIKEDRTPEDLLFQVMLDLGVALSSKIEETVIAGKKVFDVADGFLIACFDKDVNDETIKAIAQKQPYYFVMRDSSLANDSVATNFEQIFATYSPDTVRKVL